MKIFKKRIFIRIFMIIILPISLMISGCQFILPTPNLAKWTVMVYMAADNNLEAVGIEDFNEMEMVGSSNDVNIVVQMDRIPFEVLDQFYQGIYDDETNNNWTGTRRYYVTQDMDPEIIHSILKIDLGEQNMGDPSTLNDFTQWAIQNYPAERYMLILWNHGGGFRSVGQKRDICWDMTDNNDRITLPQLEDALSLTYNRLGQKIDIIGMDACFMAMVEVAYQVNNYGKILISSEASIPPEGWQYDCLLQSLVTNPNQTTMEFASKIVDCYYDQYFNSGKNVTLSAIDLDLIDEVSNLISRLAQAMINDRYTPKSNYLSARYESQYYTGTAYEYIDLKHFLSQLPSYTFNASVLSIANQINQKLELGNAVINRTSIGYDVENSHGLSIYFPSSSYDQDYDYTSFAQDKSWDEMLKYLGF